MKQNYYTSIQLGNYLKEILFKDRIKAWVIEPLPTIVLEGSIFGKDITKLREIGWSIAGVNPYDGAKNHIQIGFRENLDLVLDTEEVNQAENWYAMLKSDGYNLEDKSHELHKKLLEAS